MPGLCQELRVIDLTEGMAGALTSMILADGGAEVIKVERPEGDPTRAHPAFILWNRGKKSVVLDLKTDEGRAEVRKLAANADVLVAAWSPGVPEQLGLDYPSLRSINPGLVVCSISGFGPLKEFAHLKGYEGVVSAKTGGGYARAGQIEREGPIYSAANCGSFGAAMLALQGIFAALRVRRTTGAGQHVETSILQGFATYDWFFERWQLQQSGVSEGAFGTGARVVKIATPPIHYFAARCKDGRWLQHANLVPHLMNNWIAALGADDLRDDPRYTTALQGMDWGSDCEDLFAELQKRMAVKTVDEWMEIFAKVDVAAEPVLTTQESLSHPQIIHMGNVLDLEDPSVGMTRQLGPLAIAKENPMVPQGPAPRLGEHTEAVLRKGLLGRASQHFAGRPTPRYPLSGITVVDFGLYVAGPLGSALLADLGARCIKVEPLVGDPCRANGCVVTRVMQGKESLAIDLKKSESRGIIQRLLRRADIVSSNLRLQAAEGCGIAYEQVREINPNVVYLLAAAYGSTGPCANRPAAAPSAAAVCGGALYQTGRSMPPSDRELSYPEIRALGRSLWHAIQGDPDITGGLGVAAAALLGLHAREITGKGQYLETSMMCSSIYTNSDDALSYAGKPARLLPDEGLNGLHALYRYYRTKDGWVFLACPKQREWEAFCQAVDRPGLSQDARFSTPSARLEHDDELVPLIEGIMMKRTAIEWERFLSQKDIGCAAAWLRPFDDFANTEPAMKEAGMLVPVEHASYGKYFRYAPGINFSDHQLPIAPTSLLGDCTKAILGELGYSADEIEDFESRRVVGWPGLPNLAE